MATIGDRIFFARREKDITQEELASLVGTTKQNIYKYEKNIITNIPMDRVEAIAHHLGVSPVWLMGWAEKERPPQLSDVEKDLLSTFRLLNQKGQEAAMNTVHGLAAIPALTEEITSGVS